MTPPAIHASPDPNMGTLRDIVVQSGGRTYHLPVAVSCRLDGVAHTHETISQPSNRVVVVIACDGPSSLDLLQDEATSAPNPQPSRRTIK
jgi:hypothetical protein